MILLFFCLEIFYLRFLDVSRSKEIVMSLEVEQNHTVTTGRRRRVMGDLYQYIDGYFGDADIQRFKLKVRRINRLTYGSLY